MNKYLSKFAALVTFSVCLSHASSMASELKLYQDGYDQYGLDRGLTKETKAILDRFECGDGVKQMLHSMSIPTTQEHYQHAYNKVLKSLTSADDQETFETLLKEYPYGHENSQTIVYVLGAYTLLNRILCSDENCNSASEILAFATKETTVSVEKVMDSYCVQALLFYQSAQLLKGTYENSKIINFADELLVHTIEKLLQSKHSKQLYPLGLKALGWKYGHCKNIENTDLAWQGYQLFSKIRYDRDFLSSKQCQPNLYGIHCAQGYCLTRFIYLNKDSSLEQQHISDILQLSTDTMWTAMGESSQARDPQEKAYWSQAAFTSMLGAVPYLNNANMSQKSSFKNTIHMIKQQSAELHINLGLQSNLSENERACLYFQGVMNLLKYPGESADDKLKTFQDCYYKVNTGIKTFGIEVCGNTNQFYPFESNFSLGRFLTKDLTNDSRIDNYICERMHVTLCELFENQYKKSPVSVEDFLQKYQTEAAIAMDDRLPGTTFRWGISRSLRVRLQEISDELNTKGS